MFINLEPSGQQEPTFEPSVTEVAPRQLGGGQERGLRAGTQNVAGIVACATAARVAAEERPSAVEQTAKRRDRLVDGLVASVPGLVETGVVTGPAGPDRSGRR